MAIATIQKKCCNILLTLKFPIYLCYRDQTSSANMAFWNVKNLLKILNQ